MALYNELSISLLRDVHLGLRLGIWRYNYSLVVGKKQFWTQLSLTASGLNWVCMTHFFENQPIESTSFELSCVDDWRSDIVLTASTIWSSSNSIRSNLNNWHDKRGTHRKRRKKVSALKFDLQSKLLICRGEFRMKLTGNIDVVISSRFISRRLFTQPLSAVSKKNSLWLGQRRKKNQHVVNLQWKKTVRHSFLNLSENMDLLRT